MSISEPNKTQGPILPRGIPALRYYLGSRRALLVLGIVALVGGLALNWKWLVAVGAAPIILSVLPCLVMCALGLCMHKMSGRPAPSSAGSAAQSSEAGGCCNGVTHEPAKDKL